MKKANDALNADAMNVNPGGKQPVMRPTFYNGEVQEMNLPNGTPKGMKMVLEERGVCTQGMVARDMTARLKTYEDFKSSKPILSELIESKGHKCVYIPKFHCVPGQKIHTSTCKWKYCTTKKNSTHRTGHSNKRHD